MQTFSTASRCFSNKINFLQTIWQLAAAFVIIMVALGQTAKGRCGIRYVTQHIEMDQLAQMFKNLLFAIAVLSAQFWCKKFTNHCVLEIWFHWWHHNRSVKSWFWEKGSLKFGNLDKVMHTIAIQKNIFRWKCSFYVKSFKQPTE